MWTIQVSIMTLLIITRYRIGLKFAVSHFIGILFLKMLNISHLKFSLICICFLCCILETGRRVSGSFRWKYGHIHIFYINSIWYSYSYDSLRVKSIKMKTNAMRTIACTFYLQSQHAITNASVGSLPARCASSLKAKNRFDCVPLKTMYYHFIQCIITV